MGKVTDTSYFVVQGWMLNQLHLKGNTLQVFAIIHGFSHSEDNEYKGSLQYLCEFTGASRSTVIRSLTELQERGYIDKREVHENGVKFNRYKSSVDMMVCFDTGGSKMTLPPCQNDTTPHVKMTPHNIELNNITDNNISSNEDIYRGADKPPAPPSSSGRKRFAPPTLEEVAAYCNERHNSVSPSAFIDFYTANGWVQGRGKPIRDWKAAVRTWERRDKENPKPKQTRSAKEDYDEIFGGLL